MEKTLLGILSGIIIIVIGIYFLANGFTSETFEVNETISPHDKKSYTIYARNHVVQFMNVTGNIYDLSLSSPKDGLQIPATIHTVPVTLSWTHLGDGVSTVTIQNLDDSNLEIDAILTKTTDVSLLKYFIIIIIIGATILGFSALKRINYKFNYTIKISKTDDK